eukprot:6187331-Pleurochrysis_carterae.AAC.1
MCGHMIEVELPRSGVGYGRLVDRVQGCVETSVAAIDEVRSTEAAGSGWGGDGSSGSSSMPGVPTGRLEWDEEELSGPGKHVHTV